MSPLTASPSCSWDTGPTYDPWHMNAELGRMRLLDLTGALRAFSLAAPA